MAAKTNEEVKAYLVEALAKLLKVKAADVDTSVAFDRYGIDSASAVELTGMLGKWLSTEFEPTLLFDHPSIDQLSLFLVEASKQRA